MRIFFTLWVSLLLLGGCVRKELGPSQAYLVAFKTPKWRFADTGFIRKDADTVELEVFETGHRVIQIRISDDVCIDGEGCTFKSEFNKRYLNAAYPDDLLYHVLRSEPIHDGIDVERTGDGFVQRFKRDAFEIEYRVDLTQTVFRDGKNGILIKLKRLD